MKPIVALLTFPTLLLLSCLAQATKIVIDVEGIVVESQSESSALRVGLDDNVAAGAIVRSRFEFDTDNLPADSDARPEVDWRRSQGNFVAATSTIENVDSIGDLTFSDDSLGAAQVLVSSMPPSTINAGVDAVIQSDRPVDIFGFSGDTLTITSRSFLNRIEDPRFTVELTQVLAFTQSSLDGFSSGIDFVDGFDIAENLTRLASLPMLPPSRSFTQAIFTRPPGTGLSDFTLAFYTYDITAINVTIGQGGPLPTPVDAPTSLWLLVMGIVCALGLRRKTGPPH